MKTRQRQFAHKSSMLTLAVLVLGGAVITTLVQAADGAAVPPAPPSYLQPALYPAAPSARSQHRWLLPAGLQGRFVEGRYDVYVQDGNADLAVAGDDEPDTRMSLSVGDLRADHAVRVSNHDRAMMSDWERTRYRLNEALFSMSIGRRW